MTTQRAQIEAFARLKPSDTYNPAQQLMYQVDPHERILEVILPKDHRQGLINNSKESFAFKFAKVFQPDATQQDVFH